VSKTITDVFSAPVEVRQEPELDNTDISVVVVAYDLPQDVFSDTLSGLADQQIDRDMSPFEVVIVNNGVDFDLTKTLNGYDLNTALISCEYNVGITRARNISAQVSNGNLLMFLEDDGVPDENWVSSHYRIHNQNDICACRGRVIPKSNTILNYLQDHYDLGPESMPWFINTEGNFSIERDAFARVGGFDGDLEGRAGHEGAVLTYQLINNDADRNDIIYHPDPVIYHDYSDSILDYLKKGQTINESVKTINEKYPGLFEFMESYDEVENSSPELSNHERLLIVAIQGMRAIIARI
jgi:glycosyltransferase involved in cell wall biosynthesis